jgi:gephyrin
MARPVAGVRKHTLILTLPGSPKGAKENLEAILRLLPHACIQAAGAESRLLHIGGVKKLEKEAGVSSSGAVTGNRVLFGRLPQCPVTNLIRCSCGA